jgi:uncharacterized protein (DUF488 family)
MAPFVVFTVGHSTRTLEQFVHLLKAHAIQHVIDVRPIPRSRLNPQFAKDELSPALRRFGISYSHMPGLGGRLGGYVDYMKTQAFKDALNWCLTFPRQERVVLMCAEAVPWRCHRSLIAEALLARGVQVREITSAMETRPYPVTPPARVDRDRMTYPSSDPGKNGSGNVRLAHQRTVHWTTSSLKEKA